MKIIIAVVLLLLISVIAAAQGPAIGKPPFASFGGGPLDVLNLANLNVNIDIPIVQKAGRGAGFFYLMSYNNSIWFSSSVNGTMTWQPIANYGWQAQTNASVFGYLTHGSFHGRCGLQGPFYWGTLNWVYHDLNGAAHPLVGATSGMDCDGGFYAEPGTSNDGSGLTFTPAAGTVNGKLTTRDGRTLNLGDSGTPSSVDTNGNQITTDGTNYSDTLGSTALTISGTPPSPVTYTFPNSSGGNSTVTASYSTYTIQTNFGCSGIAEYSASGNLITSLALPDGSQYQFSYEQTPGYGSGYTTGRIASITLPTSGKIVYTYTGGNNGINCSDGSISGLTRALQAAPPVTESTWTYTRTGNTTTITGPAGNQTAIQFQGIYEAQRDVYAGTVDPAHLLQTSFTCYNGAAYPCASTPVALPITEITVTKNINNFFRQTDITYNAFGLPLVTREYDFGSGSPGALLRQTEITYTPINTVIEDHPTDMITRNGAGTIVAETQIAYDQSALSQTSGVSHHDYTNYSSGFTVRGNATTIKQWVSGTTFITTTNTYDDLGNLRSTTDQGGHTTTFNYNDNYNDGQDHNTQAFATTITYPSTGSPAVAHVTRNKFYWPSAMLYQATDQNNQATTYTYDSSWRPATVSYPDTGQTTFSYPNPQQVQVQNKIDAIRWTNSWSEVDGLGRQSRTAVANDESTPFDQADICYDPVHQKVTRSYAYQGSGIASGPNGTKQCNSSAGDVQAYDALGRIVSVTHSDGTSALTSYNGRAVQVQDEGNGSGARVTRVYQQDGLGRTLTVCELAASMFGIPSMPICGLDLAGNSNGVTTSYQYDAVDRVTQVSQGALVARQLAYDGAGHLLSEVIPEAGATTTSYSYDSEGKLYQRTRRSPNQTGAYSTTTTLSYDALHRATQVSYSDTNPSPAYSTPASIFAYDEASYSGHALQNSVGRMTHSVAAGCMGNILSYDQMGRVATEWQVEIPANCTATYALNYSYNLLGLPVSASNGVNGTAFGYTYNIAGRPTQMTSNYTGDPGHPGTLFSVAHYNAGGELISDSLGNGVNESFSYDARWRPLSASAIKGTNTLYSLGGPGTGNTMTYAPNSDVTAANDSINGNWTYGYDALDRVANAGKSGGTNFTFDVDRNANRWHQNPTGQGAQLSFDATTNRIASGNGVSYDAAGNITNDGIHSYTYDAEGRVVRVDTGSTASYDYDAFGRRIRKTVSGSPTEFLYDIAGNKVAELSAGTWSRMDFYMGGSHLGSYQGTRTYFSHADWLGTERVRTNDAGAVAQTCTSNPYGENWSCTNGGYTSQVSYAGMELDNETQLYHTLYRYYNSRLGVWMTPDPAGISAADPGNPQSLNHYAYVGNNPGNLTDPFGLFWFEERFCVDTGKGDVCEEDWVWFDTGDDWGGGGDLLGGGSGVGGGWGGLLSGLIMGPGLPKLCSVTVGITQLSDVPSSSQAEANKIFRDAGVNLKFIVGGNTPTDFVVQNIGLPPGILGYAPPGTNIAQISYANITSSAPSGVAGINIPETVGRVLAHELGHKFGLPHGEKIMRTGVEIGKLAYYLDLGGMFLFASDDKAKIKQVCINLSHTH